jgi:CIC family chloride channel protein
MEKGAAPMHIEAPAIARVPLSWLGRLRLFGHQDLAGVIFWAALVGFCGALASVLFRNGIHWLEELFTGQSEGLVSGATHLVWWYRALVPAVGGVLAGCVLHIMRLTVAASPNVDYMEAIAVGDGRIGLRATLLRSLSSLLSIASGGSIGREGAMVQLAAMLGSKLGQLAQTPIPRLRLLVACGGAAGIAAAYNAPISGALFISEIVLGSTAMESFGPLVVASVTANATIHRFLGLGPVFTVPHLHFGSNLELAFYVVLGVLAGHLAPPFLALLDFAKAQFKRLELPLYWQLGLGGLIVGVISTLVPQVWGNGYSVVGLILNSQLLGLWLLAILVAKVLATSATVGSGAVGGVFTPILLIGCALGALFGQVMDAVLPTIASPAAVYALVGMGGFLSAATLAPLTSILMIFEMTLDYDIVLPLMLACVTAHYTAKVYRQGRSIYQTALSSSAAQAREADDWRVKTVGMLIKPAACQVAGSTSLWTLFERLSRRPVERVYVMHGNELAAWFDPREVAKQLREGKIDGSMPVSAVASPVSVTLTPGMLLCEALDAFLRERVPVLPVTADRWRSTLLGEVARSDVLLAVQDRLTYPK